MNEKQPVMNVSWSPFALASPDQTGGMRSWRTAVNDKDRFLSGEKHYEEKNYETPRSFVFIQKRSVRVCQHISTCISLPLHQKHSHYYCLPSNSQILYSLVPLASARLLEHLHEKHDWKSSSGRSSLSSSMLYLLLFFRIARQHNATRLTLLLLKKVMKKGGDRW